MAFFGTGGGRREDGVRDSAQFKDESPEYAELERERAEMLTALGHWTRRCDEDPEYAHLGSEIERYRQRVTEATDAQEVRAIRESFNVFTRNAIPKGKK